MLLSPQHLQQWDRQVHHLIGERVRACQSFDFGLTHLEIDREALRNGRFALLAASGVLPDGTPFAAPEEDPLPAARAIGERFGARADTLPVSIGLPSVRRGRPTLGDAPAPGAPGPRFAHDTVELPDDNDGTNERPVGVARANLCVLFPDDAVGDHDLLPIAEVIRTPEGGFALNESFVPPCLWIGASDALLSSLNAALQILITRSRNLSEKRGQRGDIADFAASDSYSFWLLHSVNAAIPWLSHILAHRRAHPEQAYVGLASLVGTLATFSAKIDPAGIPAYDHPAPAAAFARLGSMLRDVLEGIVPSKLVRIGLEKKDGAIYFGRITDARVLAPTSNLFLAARADLEADALMQRFATAKVAALERIDALIASALPGVPMRHSRVLPPALPARDDCVYFELTPKGNEWEGVRGAQNLAVYMPGVPGLTLELIGLRD